MAGKPLIALYKCSITLVVYIVFRVTWQLTKKVLAMLAGLFLISLAGLAVFAVYSGVTSLVGMLL